MKIQQTARTIIGMTALAWAIPFAQAGTGVADTQVGVVGPQGDSAGFTRLDTDHDGFLSRAEVRALKGYEDGFAEADRDGDGRLSPIEAVTAQQLYERGLAKSYTSDAWITTKVKTALLREKGLDSFDVSVETFHHRVLLSGFVDDAAQKQKALLVASRVDGVEQVKDALQVRN